MGFEKGNKLGRGGVRPRAGRPSNAEKAKALEEMKQQKTARDVITHLLEKAAKGVGERYITFAMQDPATCRHLIDKVLPSDPLGIHISGPVGIDICLDVSPQIVDEIAPKRIGQAIEAEFIRVVEEPPHNGNNQVKPEIKIIK